MSPSNTIPRIDSFTVSLHLLAADKLPATRAVQGNYQWPVKHVSPHCMFFLPDAKNCGLRMRRECREHFPRHRGLAIPACITARVSRTCRDACRDRELAVSLEFGGGENIPGILDACATRNLTYLLRGPLGPRQGWCQPMPIGGQVSYPTDSPLPPD